MYRKRASAAHKLQQPIQAAPQPQQLGQAQPQLPGGWNPALGAAGSEQQASVPFFNPANYQNGGSATLQPPLPSQPTNQFSPSGHIENQQPLGVPNQQEPVAPQQHDSTGWPGGWADHSGQFNHADPNVSNALNNNMYGGQPGGHAPDNKFGGGAPEAAYGHYDGYTNSRQPSVEQAMPALPESQSGAAPPPPQQHQAEGSAVFQPDQGLGADQTGGQDYGHQNDGLMNGDGQQQADVSQGQAQSQFDYQQVTLDPSGQWYWDYNQQQWFPYQPPQQDQMQDAGAANHEHQQPQSMGAAEGNSMAELEGGVNSMSLAAAEDGRDVSASMSDPSLANNAAAASSITGDGWEEESRTRSRQGSIMSNGPGSSGQEAMLPPPVDQGMAPTGGSSQENPPGNQSADALLVAPASSAGYDQDHSHHQVSAAVAGSSMGPPDLVDHRHKSSQPEIVSGLQLTPSVEEMAGAAAASPHQLRPEFSNAPPQAGRDSEQSLTNNSFSDGVHLASAQPPPDMFASLPGSHGATSSQLPHQNRLGVGLAAPTPDLAPVSSANAAGNNFEQQTPTHSYQPMMMPPSPMGSGSMTGPDVAAPPSTVSTAGGGGFAPDLTSQSVIKHAPVENNDQASGMEFPRQEQPSMIHQDAPAPPGAFAVGGASSSAASNCEPSPVVGNLSESVMHDQHYDFYSRQLDPSSCSSSAYQHDPVADNSLPPSGLAMMPDITGGPIGAPPQEMQHCDSGGSRTQGAGGSNQPSASSSSGGSAGGAGKAPDILRTEYHHHLQQQQQQYGAGASVPTSDRNLFMETGELKEEDAVRVASQPPPPLNIPFAGPPSSSSLASPGASIPYSPQVLGNSALPPIGTPFSKPPSSLPPMDGGNEPPPPPSDIRMVVGESTVGPTGVLTATPDNSSQRLVEGESGAGEDNLPPTNRPTVLGGSTDPAGMSVTSRTIEGEDGAAAESRPYVVGNAGVGAPMQLAAVGGRIVPGYFPSPTQSQINHDPTSSLGDGVPSDVLMSGSPLSPLDYSPIYPPPVPSSSSLSGQEQQLQHDTNENTRTEAAGSERRDQSVMGGPPPPVKAPPLPTPGRDVAGQESTAGANPTSRQPPSAARNAAAYGGTRTRRGDEHKKSTYDDSDEMMDRTQDSDLEESDRGDRRLAPGRHQHQRYPQPRRTVSPGARSTRSTKSARGIDRYHRDSTDRDEDSSDRRGTDRDYYYYRDYRRDDGRQHGGRRSKDDHGRDRKYKESYGGRNRDGGDSRYRDEDDSSYSRGGGDFYERGDRRNRYHQDSVASRRSVRDDPDDSRYGRYRDEDDSSYSRGGGDLASERDRRDRYGRHRDDRYRERHRQESEYDRDSHYGDDMFNRTSRPASRAGSVSHYNPNETSYGGLAGMYNPYNMAYFQQLMNPFQYQLQNAIREMEKAIENPQNAAIYKQHWDYYDKQPQLLDKLRLEDPIKFHLLQHFKQKFWHLVEEKKAAVGGAGTASEKSFATEFHQLSPSHRPESRAAGQESTIHPPAATVEDSEVSGLTTGGETSGGLVLPQRLTPMMFTRPHVCARISSSGLLLKVEAASPQEGQNATVELHSMSALLGHTREYRELVVFPGPLMPRETHKNDVIKFCERKIRDARGDRHMMDRESYILLWNMLILLLRQKGQVEGSDLADLLLSDKYRNEKPNEERSRTSSVRSGQPNSYDPKDGIQDDLGLGPASLPVEDDQAEGEAGLVVTHAKTYINTTPQDETVSRFRSYMLHGNKSEGLEFAMKAGEWGHALFLASKMDQRTHASVMTRFANGLAINDPLQTLYQLMSAKIPAAMKNCADQRWGDWRPHLAMVLSNPQPGSDINRRSMVTLGDTLASRGQLYAAQFCYIVSAVEFGTYSKKSSKMVLLCSSPEDKGVEEFATNEAIQCTEIYEFVQKLSNPELEMPTLQPFKFLHAVRLCEVGLVNQAQDYCREIAESVMRSPAAHHDFIEDFHQQLLTLSERLKYHDPQYTTSSGELNEIADPDWLVRYRDFVHNAAFNTDQSGAVSASYMSGEYHEGDPSSAQLSYDQYYQSYQYQQEYAQGEEQHQQEVGANGQYETHPPAAEEGNRNEAAEGLYVNGEYEQQQPQPADSGQSVGYPGDAIASGVYEHEEQPQVHEMPPTGGESNEAAAPEVGDGDLSNQPPPMFMNPYSLDRGATEPGGGVPPAQPPNLYSRLGSRSRQTSQCESDPNAAAGNYYGMIQAGGNNSGPPAGRKPSMPSIMEPGNLGPKSDPGPPTAKPLPAAENKSGPPAAAASEKKKKAAKDAPAAAKKSSWLGSIFGKILRPPNQVHLPDDSNKKIVFDDKLGRWKNLDDDDEDSMAPAAPPPMDPAFAVKGALPPSSGPGDGLPQQNGLSSPLLGGGMPSSGGGDPGGNFRGYQPGGKRRGRGYVDVLGQSGVTKPVTALPPMMLDSPSSPPPTSMLGAPSQPAMFDPGMGMPPTTAGTDNYDEAAGGQPPSSLGGPMASPPGGDATESSPSDAPPMMFNPSSMPTMTAPPAF